MGIGLKKSKVVNYGWKLLGVVQNAARVEMLKVLLEFELCSLSEIARILEKRGWKMTLSGVLKHIRELEKAGLVRSEPGIFAKTPDARKTIYFLEGRERVQQILEHLQSDVLDLLWAGLVFYQTLQMAHQVQSMRHAASGDKSRFVSLLDECESESVYPHLTDDEKKKLKLWRLILSAL